MEKLPLVGVYRKSPLPPPETGTENPSPMGEEPSPLTDRRKTARPHPHSSLCILTLLDSAASASLLEKWRKEGVRLHRAPKAEEAREAGVWVRLLSPKSESPAKGSFLLPVGDSEAMNEGGLIPSAAAVQQNEIFSPPPPHARPCNRERAFPAYVARLYSAPSEPSRSVISTYV